MRAVAAFVSVALLASEACLGHEDWPQWARELTAELECGMTIEQVRQLTNERINALEGSGHPVLGTHYIRKLRSDLWLRFNEAGRLESVTLSQVDGWRVMATRLSPRQDLCSGDLTFFLRALFTRDLEGAILFLDGQRVDPHGGMLEIPAGDHELRIEKEGYEPILRHLHFGPGDRGDYRLDLTREELRPQGQALPGGAGSSRTVDPRAGGPRNGGTALRSGVSRTVVIDEQGVTLAAQS